MLLNRTTQQSAKRETLGPSTEIVLDNASTPLIVSGQLPEKTIVLTFDDGPHPTRTSQLLSLLRAEKAKVQFFLVGQNTTRLNDVVREEQADGHEIGCHSYTHPDMRKMKFENAVAEIENGFSAITEALGYSGSFFRFPYGASTKDLRAHLLTTQTTEFWWNSDNLDWKYPDPTYLSDYAFYQIESEGR